MFKRIIAGIFFKIRVHNHEISEYLYTIYGLEKANTSKEGREKGKPYTRDHKREKESLCRRPMKIMHEISFEL